MFRAKENHAQRNKGTYDDLISYKGYQQRDKKYFLKKKTKLKLWDWKVQ